MDTFAVYFNPLGTLSSSISSDTLFGAVCWGIQILGLKPDLSEWLTDQQDNPPFAFSAPFPTILLKERRLHLYPRPLTLRVNTETVEQVIQTLNRSKETLKTVVKNAKRINSSIWISEGVLEQVMQKALRPVDILQRLDKDFVLHEGVLYLRTEVKYNPPALSRSQPVLHNQIDRVAGATVEGALFYETETFFAPGTGLWALLRAEKQDFKTLIEPALRYLADTGLGANRATGKGHFKIEYGVAPTFPRVNEPQGRLLLSRFLPTRNEMQSLTNIDKLTYRIRTIRAKREKGVPVEDSNQTSTAIYKRSVRMFEPGSVLPLPSAEIHGRLALVVKEHEGHPVFQSGAALSLPIGGL
mgnify:CR=1 FL=1|jgi:CRISPR-associated protein Csm4